MNTLNNQDKIASFKYSFKNGCTIDAKDLSIALDGINDLLLNPILELMKDEISDDKIFSELKERIAQEKKGVDVIIKEGSVEIIITAQIVNEIFNSGVMEIASGLIPLENQSLPSIFKYYKNKQKTNHRIIVDEEQEQEQKNRTDHIRKELASSVDEVEEIKGSRKKSKPTSPFIKIFSPINFNINLGIQVHNNTQEVKETEVVHQDKLLFKHSKEYDVVLPEWEHGKIIKLKGKISKGTEKNDFSVKIQGGHVIKCISKYDLKGINFTFAVITGEVDREYNNLSYSDDNSNQEKTPRIKNATIEYINDKEQKNTQLEF